MAENKFRLEESKDWYVYIQRNKTCKRKILKIYLLFNTQNSFLMKRTDLIFF